MDIESLLSAAFLHLQAEERGTCGEDFFSNLATEDIIDIAEQEGYEDLASAFKKSNEAVKGMGSACTGGELEDAEREFYKQREFIESHI